MTQPSDIADMCRRHDAYRLSEKLAEGWYPSGHDEHGVIEHDRHVLTHVRAMEALLAEAAVELDRRLEIIGVYDIELQKQTWRND